MPASPVDGAAKINVRVRGQVRLLFLSSLLSSSLSNVFFTFWVCASFNTYAQVCDGAMILLRFLQWVRPLMLSLCFLPPFGSVSSRLGFLGTLCVRSCLCLFVVLLLQVSSAKDPIFIAKK
ncbi:uncharacterized protein J3R85_010497 [Psidium guajava]|nr:uncharacterized protein J3R85_010497 [Psidium guajava]